jgi:hypothetical protein
MLGGQVSSWVSFGAGTALTFPSNGRGGVAVVIVASTAGSTTYTTTTVTDSAPWALGATAIGSYVYTSAGFYGVVTAVAAPVVTVDRWRRPGIRSGGLPADGTAATIFQASHLGTYTSVIIDQVTIATTSAGAAVAITDQKGTTYPGMSFVPVTGHPKTFNFGPPGLQVNGPFGVIAALTTTTGIVLYRAIE